MQQNSMQQHHAQPDRQEAGFHIDPVTLEMLWRRLVSIVGELGSTLRRTSFSTVVRDIGDYGCAIFDSQGRLLAQTPDSTPGLCGPLGHMLRELLKAIPPETLEEGDLLIGNNPWAGSGHHNDVTIALPVFHKGARVAQGDVVGYVGATGLATGPHLHYEFRINDVHQNPLRVVLPSAPPIDAAQKPAFDAGTASLTQRLQLLRGTNLARLD